LNLHAECGPEILQEASIKAVRQWTYKPYLLHGEPVEVETEIRVGFALGDKKKLPFSKDSCPVGSHPCGRRSKSYRRTV